MSDSHRPHLPGSRPLKPKPLFPIGSRVVLASCPSEIPGVVQGMRGKKICVEWRNLHYLGKHRPSALVLVEKSEANRGDR